VRSVKHKINVEEKNERKFVQQMFAILKAHARRVFPLGKNNI
jgi:hypothetical protein